MLGKLFWRFFLGFWLCLIAAALVTTGIHQVLTEDPPESEFVQGPRSMFIVDMATTVLRNQGPQALQDLMEGSRSRSGRPPPLYLVNQQGKELLGRELPDGLPPGAVEVSDDTGQVWSVYLMRGARPIAGPGRQAPGGPYPPGPPPWPSLLLGVALLASFVFAAVLAYRFSLPFGRLRAGFEQVASGRLDTRLSREIEPNDEVGQLLKGFDQMASQLQAQMDQQKALLHDVSHELRSPLARLSMAAGLARQNPQKWEECLSRVENEAERLDHLIGQLLHLSRLQTQISLDKAPHNVMELLGNVLEDAQFEAQQLGKQVHIESTLAEWIMLCNPDALHSAFENVIRNALRHTPEGGAVWVSCAVTPLEGQGALKISIRDEGPGLPQEALQHLFTPFFKQGPHKGYGLGLAIVKKALELHGGSVQAFNLTLEKGKSGLRVDMVLPAAPHSIKD